MLITPASGCWADQRVLLAGLLDLDLLLGLGRLLDGSLLGHADEDRHDGVDLAVEVDLDLVPAGGLDRGAAHEALAIDLYAELLLDGGDDLGAGHGAKELVVLADLGVDGDGLAVELGLGRLCIADALLLALLDVVTALLKLLDVARGGRLGDLAGEQEEEKLL